MKQCLLARPGWRRYSRAFRIVACSSRTLTIHHAGLDKTGVDTFRSMTYSLTTPLLLQDAYQSLAGGSSIPALTKWFNHDGDQAQPTTYLAAHAAALFPYEMMSPQNQGPCSQSVDAVQSFHEWLGTRGEIEGALAQILTPKLGFHFRKPTFHRFDAPLQLLLLALAYNNSHDTSALQLYIAQSSIQDLPAELQQDLPTPALVAQAGRGDVYSSSIWLGLEPTYSPLHRDPNPNLFYQLCGQKHFRLLTPAAGDRLFRKIQSTLGAHHSSRIRGSEMMDGPESELLRLEVWGPDSDAGVICAQLAPGDAIFIPKGWWHSVGSSCSDGRLNGSVNWWFR